MVAILYGDGHQDVAIPTWDALYTAAPAAVERRATTTTSSSSSQSTKKVKTVVTTIATTTTITGHSSTSSSSGSMTTGTGTGTDSSNSSEDSSSSTSGTWVSAYEVLGSETVSAYKNSDGEIVSVAYVVSGGSITVVPYTGTATSLSAAPTTTDATTTAESTAAAAASASSTAASQSSDNSKNTSHVGIIVGVVAIFVALIALLLILYFLFRYRRSRGLEPFFGRLGRSRTNITKQSQTAGVVPDRHGGFDKETSAGMPASSTIRTQKATRHVREKSRSLPPSPAASSIFTFPSIHHGAQGQIQMHPAPQSLAARRSMRPQLVEIPQRSPDTPPPIPSAYADHMRTSSFPHVASAVAARPVTSSTMEPFRQSITSSALISPSRLFPSAPESDDGMQSGSWTDSRTDSRTDSHVGSRASSHAPMAAAARNPSYSTIPRSIARKPLAIAKIDTQRQSQSSPESPIIGRSPLSPPPRATLRRLDGSRTRVLSGIDAPASPPPMQAPPPLPPGTGIGRRTSIQGLEFYGYGTPAMVRVPISRYQASRPMS